MFKKNPFIFIFIQLYVFFQYEILHVFSPLFPVIRHLPRYQKIIITFSDNPSLSLSMFSGCFICPLLFLTGGLRSEQQICIIQMRRSCRGIVLFELHRDLKTSPIELVEGLKDLNNVQSLLFHLSCKENFKIYSNMMVCYSYVFVYRWKNQQEGTKPRL